VAISKFKGLGYLIVQGQSDWTIGTADQEIQQELLSGWADAAREINSLPRHDIDDWLTRRRSAVQQRVSSMRVGHVDFCATPSVMR
jgi:hypothetical protein